MKMMTMMFGEAQPMLSYPSDCKALILINERKEKMPSMEDGMDEVESYIYDGLFIETDSPAEPSVLRAVKREVTKNINEYDASDAVNSFFINGQKLWLDKNTRTGLMARLNAEKADGKEITTLWYGVNHFTLSVESAINMLTALELYASNCYDVTHSHIARVCEMASIQSVLAYDYKRSYPEKLTFDGI